MNSNLDFSIGADRKYTRPVIDLYGMKALIDSGAENIIIGVSPKYLSQRLSITDMHHITHVDGINKAPEEETLGEVYQIRHFQIGQMEYWDIPVVIKDINNENIDIVLGSAMFGPGAYSYYDKENEKVVFHFPEMIAKSGKLWTKENGVWTIMNKIKNSEATPAEN